MPVWHKREELILVLLVLSAFDCSLVLLLLRRPLLYNIVYQIYLMWGWNGTERVLGVLWRCARGELGGTLKASPC